MTYTRQKYIRIHVFKKTGLSAGIQKRKIIYHIGKNKGNRCGQVDFGVKTIPVKGTA